MAHRPKHARALRAQTRLPPEEDPEFQIAPMIDILLVLLVFFMSISSTQVLQVSKGVRLPVAKDAKKKDAKGDKGEAIVNVLWSSINNSGSIEIDNQKFAQPNQIMGLLKTKAQANPAMRILIRADKDVRYDFLKQVMITAGQAGVGKVTFSVVDKVGGDAGT